MPEQFSISQASNADERRPRPARRAATGARAARLTTAGGFTAIELLVTISMIGIMAALAMPAFNEWIVNTRIRTAAETLQNSLRLAQAEAVRRNRQVVFSLTNLTPGVNQTATTNARNWMIQTVPAMLNNSEQVDFVQGGSFADGQQNVTVSGPAAICFNSIGRVVANTTPGVGVACALPTNSTARTEFIVTTTNTGAPYRTLKVTVAIGGQIRMCDALRSIANSPDGCQS